MKEKYYAGDRGLKPFRHLCYTLCEDTNSDFRFATKDLDRGNIRWAIWSQENGQKRIKFVLYRDRKGLVWRTK